jgi:hypothetical protein
MLLDGIDFSCPVCGDKNLTVDGTQSYKVIADKVVEKVLSTTVDKVFCIVCSNDHFFFVVDEPPKKEVVA